MDGRVAVIVGVSCHEENNMYYIGDSTVLLVPEVLYQLPLMPDVSSTSLHTYPFIKVV